MKPSDWRLNHDNEVYEKIRCLVDLKARKGSLAEHQQIDLDDLRKEYHIDNDDIRIYYKTF